MATYEITNITIPSGTTVHLQGNSRFFTSGSNTVLSSRIPSPGYITNSSKDVMFTVYTSKSVEDMSSFSLDSFSGLTIRSISGYPYYDTTQMYNLSSLPSGVTASITKVGTNALRIRLAGTNAFVTSSGGSTVITNNTTLSAAFSSLVITMS